MMNPLLDNPEVSIGDRIFPLEPGDRLSRDEFERRYEAMPHLKKAELIEGVVYMSAAVRLRKHGQPHARLVGWLINYDSVTPGLVVADNTSIRLDMDNEPQPDAALIIDPTRGGQARISQDDYLEGAPELAAEIASSSASYDLGVKLRAYERNGVREYIVWRVLEREIDWFTLGKDGYEKFEAGADGILRSVSFPGLWLDKAALLRGDMARVLDVVRMGTATKEHADFCKAIS